MEKVVVIGAGPAGMMAAISASFKADVILVERNDELGKKLKITGGGRCNITNKRDIEDFFSKIIRNHKFLYSSFYSFTNQNLLDFFSTNGVEFKVEEDFKVYPKNDKSNEIINTLENILINSKVEILKNCKVIDLVVKSNIVYGVKLENEDILNCDKVIIACGGMSYPHTGCDGMFYDILKQYGHTIEKIYPALVSLIVKENFVKNISGVSMNNVKVRVNNKKLKKLSLSGDILFSHFGLTGPVILNLSSYINRYLDEEDVEIIIDFLPNISREDILQKIRENDTKTIYNNLKNIMPLNLIKELLIDLNIDKKPCQLNKEDEKLIIDAIKECKFTCIDTSGIKSSIITSGGISVKDISSSTMESKKIKNLYFAGEIIDVEGLTGGYNLQIAFSTGYLAGQLL